MPMISPSACLMCRAKDQRIASLEAQLAEARKQALYVAAALVLKVDMPYEHYPSGRILTLVAEALRHEAEKE